jgi:hypothetical protein
MARAYSRYATVTGADGVRSELLRLARDFKKSAERSLYKFAQIEMREMKKRVPVDTGTLRDSGTVDEPKWSGNNLSVDLGFGGAAEDYAIVVHEDLEAFHPVGQAKYVESVLNESAPYLASRLAADIKRDLGM